MCTNGTFEYRTYKNSDGRGIMLRQGDPPRMSPGGERGAVMDSRSGLPVRKLEIDYKNRTNGRPLKNARC